MRSGALIASHWPTIPPMERPQKLTRSSHQNGRVLGALETVMELDAHRLSSR